DVVPTPDSLGCRIRQDAVRDRPRGLGPVLRVLCFCIRAYNALRCGRRAMGFAPADEHVPVGYGLEGALPHARGCQLVHLPSLRADTRRPQTARSPNREWRELRIP